MFAHPARNAMAVARRFFPAAFLKSAAFVDMYNLDLSDVALLSALVCLASAVRIDPCSSVVCFLYTGPPLIGGLILEILIGLLLGGDTNANADCWAKSPIKV